MARRSGCLLTADVPNPHSSGRGPSGPHHTLERRCDIERTPRTPEGRRWRDGDYIEISGVPFRVRKGEKGEYDLVVMVMGPERYRKVDMRMVGMLFDFFVENEDILFQERTHWRQDPMELFLQFLRDSWHLGHAEAHERYIERYRAAKEVPYQQDRTHHPQAS